MKLLSISSFFLFLSSSFYYNHSYLYYSYFYISRTSCNIQFIALYVLSFHFVCAGNDDDGGNIAHTTYKYKAVRLNFHGLDNHNHKTYSIKHK